jgi:hypothetical protein
MDQYESLIKDLRKSINFSSSKLEELKRTSKMSTEPGSPRVAPNSMHLPTASIYDKKSLASPTHSSDTIEDKAMSSQNTRISAESQKPPRNSPNSSSSVEYSRPITPVTESASKAPSPTIGSNNASSNSTILNWTVLEVADWITSIGFSQFAENFKRNEISGREMIELTLPTLKELDIPALGKRIQIMNAIIALKEEHGLPTVFHHGRVVSSGSNTASVRIPSPPVSPSQVHHDRRSRENARVGSQMSSTRSSQHSHVYSTSPNLPPTPQLDPSQSLQFTARWGPPGSLPSNGFPERALPSTDRIATHQQQAIPTDFTRITLGSLASIEREGTLKTLENTNGYGDKFGEYKKRWIVLQGKLLYWFRDKDKSSHAVHRIQLHSGYKIASEEHKRGKFGFRITELCPEAGPPKNYFFVTDDSKECSNWIKALTKITITHSQHDACKFANTQGPEIITDPRELISSIRLNDDQLFTSELGQIARDWTRDPISNGDGRQGIHSPGLQVLSPFAAMRRPSNQGSVRHAQFDPMQMNRYGEDRGRASMPESSQYYDLPYSDRRQHEPSRITVSDPCDPRNQRRRPSHVSSNHSGKSPHLDHAHSNGKWDDGREAEITRLRFHEQIILQVNSFLPPHESVKTIRELVSGLSFIHYLTNFVQTPLPPQYARALRDPASYRIDWIDNWGALYFIDF